VYVDPTWTPVIGEALRWVKDFFFRNKTLRLDVERLKGEVERLSYGNADLAMRQNEILSAVMSDLRTEQIIIIQDGNAYFLSCQTDNNSALDLQDSMPTTFSLPVSAANQTAVLSVSSIFDGVDDEIAIAKLTRPSQRDDEKCLS